MCIDFFPPTENTPIYHKSLVIMSIDSTIIHSFLFLFIFILVFKLLSMKMMALFTKQSLLQLDSSKGHVLYVLLLYTEGTFWLDSRDSLWTGTQRKLVSSPVLYLLLFLFCPQFCSEACVISLVRASVCHCFLTCYLHCLSFSGSCPPLYPWCFLSRLPYSFPSTDCLRIHSSTPACPLMAVAGVLPGESL